MTISLFRFRSIEALFKWNELEKQSIFFPEPSTLNDPMEGYIDCFWQGDEIVWTNFFTHYFICLHFTHLEAILTEPNERLTKANIPVLISKSSLEKSGELARIQNTLSQFIDCDEIKATIGILASRNDKIRRDELLIHLDSVHVIAMKVLFNLEELNTKLSLANKINSDSLSDEMRRFIYLMMGQLRSQTRLLSAYQDKEFSKNHKRRFVVVDFPEAYLERIQSLLYPDWYTACFTEDIENSAAWGHYAGNHSGICLKFKIKVSANGSLSLPLKGLSGSSIRRGDIEARSINSKQDYPFYKVVYEGKYPEVDFFRSIARLSFPDLLDTWYSNGSGKFSTCSQAFSNEYEWRTDIWKKFRERVSTKLKDWEYEKEQRLVLCANFLDFSNEKTRAFTYDFSDLEGIIFGIKTTLEHKIEIMKIVENKCHEKNCYDIKFYQARYSHSDGKIKIDEMDAFYIRPATTVSEIQSPTSS